MRCFLDACDDQHDPKTSICPRILPLADMSINACPDTPLTNNLLPTTNPSCTTPSPLTPLMMACITTSPDPTLPSTHQPLPPQTCQSSNGPTRTSPPAPAPLVEDIEEPSTRHVSPPQPPPTTSQPSFSSRCPSPISEDPSTVTFPTPQTSTSLHSFRQQYKASFAAEITFSDFETLTATFTAEAVELSRHLNAQQRPKPAPRRPDRPSARPPVDYR